jgi:hypothetical protein
LNKGFLTQSYKGKTYFSSWSSDIKFEKKNAVRHLDMTTHNHKGGTPTTVSTGPDQGVQTIPTPEDPCKEAHNANEKQRDKIADKPDRISGSTSNGIDGCGVTISSGVFTPAGNTGASSLITGQSNYTSLTTDVVNNVAEGSNPQDRKSGSQLECGEESHQYSENGSAYSCTCNGGHGEARILDTLAGRSDLNGSTLTLNIDWRNKTKGQQKIPCPDCYRMICYALKCDMTIKICRDEQDKDPVDMKDKCKHGKSGYKKMEKEFIPD